MKEPTFNKSYTNIRQQMYDTALTSEYFDLASFNAAEQSGDSKRADVYLNIANMTKGLTSPEFNKDVFDMFSGDYEFQMSYLHNKLLQDPNEIKDGVNVYQVTNDYLNARIEQKEREVWYNNLNDLEKFSVDLGLLLGDIGNTLYGIVDSVGDAVILLGAASADVLTGGAFHEQISEGSKKAITTDWSRTDEIARELDKYKSVSRLSTGWFGKTIDEIAVGIANMAPLLIPGVGSLVYAGTMLGGAAEEAVTKNPDIDLFDLTLYSAAVTGVEYGTEWISGKIFGGMDFVGSKMFGTSTRQAKNWFTYSLSNFMSEAFEEGISEIADSILNIAFVDPYAEVASFQEVLHAALIGGAIGFSMAGLGGAFTRNGAIDTKTGQFIKNYKAAMNQWIDGDGNIYNNESDARKSGRKDVRQRYNEGDLTKLSKIETMNMASQLGNAIQYMNTDPLEDFYTKYQRDNPNLTIEQVQVEHPEEYAKALAESKDSAKVIADAAAMLATVYEQAGAEGFIKATDILKSTRETQSRLIKNAVEYTPSKVLKYRVLEKAIMSKFPNTTFKVNENLTAAQIRLQDTVRSNYGLDVVFGDYGNYNGNAASTSFAVSENTVVLDNKYYEKLSDRTIAEKFAKNALIESLQMSSGILSAENIKNLNKILDKSKHTGYNDSTLQDSLDLSKSVEELKNTEVEKLSEQELRKYAELQKNTLAQLLMFDELTISEVFIGAPKTFKQMWQWLTKQGNFLKNAIKTPINKMKYNYVLKAQRKYENAMAKKSPNINFMRAAANDVGADDDALKRMERIFDPNSKRKDFIHWNYLPITENSNLKDYLNINDKLFELTNNKFTFKDAFNPAIYSEKVLEDYKLMDFSNNKTFKYNLQDYLINNFGFVIDDVHEQFVRVTQFDEHTSDVFTLNMMSVLDGTMTLDDLQFEHPSVGSIFNDEFNSNVYSRETGDNLYNYQLIFQPVNRLDAGEKYGKTIVNNTEKTVVVFIDPTSKNLQNELIQAEHTIYHETQHIIADWTNLYQGADREVLSDAMRSEPKQDKIKNLYEMLNDDKFVQSDEQYAILAEQIYSLLGGEWLAESERLKYDKSTSKKVYDKLNVFGQTDYLDIQYRPNGVGTDLIIKGYGFYSNVKIELFTNKATTFSAERVNDISNIQGNLTEEFKELQSKQRWKTEAKRLIDDNMIGDEVATNEVISKLYPDNKHARTIEYVNQVMNDMPYLLWYKKRNPNIDKTKVLDMNEVRQFVESDLDTQEKLKQYEEKQNQAGDYVKRHYILNADFNYTLNDVSKIEATTNLTESHRGQRAMEQQTTVDERSESYEEAQEAITETAESAEAKYEMLDTAVEQIKNNIEKTPEKGFEFINNLLNYAKNNLDNSQQKYLEKQLINENILPKKQYEKLINKYKTELSSKTLNSEETELFNKNISEFADINQYRDYVDDLKEIARRHEKDIQNIVEKPTEKEPVKEKKPRKKKTVIETLETAKQSESSSLGDTIVALMESDEIKTRMSEVQNVGESNQELKSVSKDIWRNHADIFAGINDSNYETIRDTIEKSGNRTALIEFDYYCREFKGRFNKETTKLIDVNAQKVLHESGQVLSTQSHTLYNAKPINDIVNSLGNDGYTVDVDDSVIAEYDERLANKDKHIADLEQQIKDLEQQLQNKDLNALEKADISDELQKVAEEKYVFENGSNVDLMDWLLNNVDAPTIAEVFAKQTEIQKSFLDKLISSAERAQIEGKDVGFYLKNKETGDIKAFPKTREFLAKWLKKARNYRMWAMLSSPTTWVRNWVGNTGMRSLDTVTNAFERMLSRKVFADIDYTEAINTIQSNNVKISQLFDKLNTLNEGTTEYKNLENQIKKLQKDTHKLEFDMGQLKYQETKAGKEVYDYIAEQYGDYILNHLIRKSDSKYDETGGKGGALKQIERDIAYQSANTLQKLVIKAQDITRYGLETGPFGDEPMQMNAIIKNFSNLIASNTDYLLAGIQVEYDVLSKKTKPSETDKKRLTILDKALKTQDVKAICDAINESETKRLFDSAAHRAEEQYFKNGNWLSRTMSDLAKKSPVFGEIMSWVMPFPKVAANILTMAYKYSPAGFISTLVQWSKYKQKASETYTGEITGFEKADIIRSASQATTGTFMLIAGALAAALGWIDIDDDDYLGPALKVGNFMRISLKDLAPSMTTFSTAAALVYSWKNHKSGVEEALNNLYDNTLLGNVDNIFRYGGLTKFAENLPISLTGQYVPAVLKLINNTVFKTPQKDKSGNLLEKTWKTLAASIPGLSATVPNKINPYTGEPMYASGSENWFLNFLAKASPITVKYTYGKSALEKEAERLGSGTTGASGSFTINGTNYTVKNKESIAKFRANYLESEFDKIQSGKTLVTVKDEKSGKMITTSYSKLTDAQKQNVLTSLYSKASNASKIEYWTKSGNKYVATTTEEYQTLKKTVTTPSKIIFNKNWSKSKFVEG